MPDLARWLRTVRHLRPVQGIARVRLALRRRTWERSGERVDARYRRRAAALRAARFDDAGIAAVAAHRIAAVPATERVRVARDALAGTFEFLGRRLELGKDFAWHRPDLDVGTRLWKTQLHEFPFALDLAAAWRSTGEPAFRERLLELVARWEAESPIGRPGFALDAWNARAVATRLANLATSASVLGLSGDEREGASLGALLARHALFLRDNLERDLGANHLLRDGVGLVYADVLFGGFADGIALLREQVEEQVLADGGHVERAPLYHAVVLEDLLEVRFLLGERAPAWLRDAVLRMGGYLEHLLHGDGELPLFGDSWLGELSAGRLLAEVRELPEAAEGLPRPPDAGRASGLLALARGDAKVLVRAGAHGPDWQLGHAHGDLLSFELSRGARRVVTDTGTLTYDPGPERAALRATAAHNTIELDGESQIEAWGSFRVGRRGRARTVAIGASDPWSWAWLTHDAYAWLAGRPAHHRLLALSPDALVVLDAVCGAGRHRVASRLHLVPDLPVGCIHVKPLRGEAKCGAAPWHPRWGAREQSVRVVIEETAELPWVGGWILGLGGDPPEPVEPAVQRHPAGVQVHFPGVQLGLEIDWTIDRRGGGALRVEALPGGR
jgi:uncharacterized heparinase superfamily protein